jgi:hypothetical protein
MSKKKQRQAAMQEKRNAKYAKQQEQQRKAKKLGKVEQDKYHNMYQDLNSDLRQVIKSPSHDPNKADYVHLRVVHQKYLRRQSEPKNNSNNLERRSYY